MRTWKVFTLFLSLSAAANCQVPAKASPQFQKEWVLGQHVAADLERQDGKIGDPALVEYLQHVETAIANAAGVPPMEVRVTRSEQWYAALLPNRVLYLSGRLLERIENEAELAGLLAHELNHTPQDSIAGSQAPGVAVYRGGCVLASSVLVFRPEGRRERERQATAAAVPSLKAAGYDPAGVLDLLSKLVNEHPAWAAAIVPQDLLELRGGLEAETVPPAGYRIDSSGFRRGHTALETALGRVPVKKRSTPPSLSWTH